MKKSAGILLYRKKNGLEIFLAHPGGPFFATRDDGVWSIPKGEFKEGEDACAAAKREFKEETGFDVPDAELIPLTPVEASNKIIYAWAVEGDADPEQMKSNTFKLWGKEFPEMDKGAWFDFESAKKKISPAQVKFIAELQLKIQ